MEFLLRPDPPPTPSARPTLTIEHFLDNPTWPLPEQHRLYTRVSADGHHALLNGCVGPIPSWVSGLYRLHDGVRLTTFTPSLTPPAAKNTYFPNSFALSGDAAVAVIADAPHVALFDAFTGHLLARTPALGPISDVAVTRDGTLFLAAVDQPAPPMPEWEEPAPPPARPPRAITPVMKLPGMRFDSVPAGEVHRPGVLARFRRKRRPPVSAPGPAATGAQGAAHVAAREQLWSGAGISVWDSNTCRIVFRQAHVASPRACCIGGSGGQFSQRTQVYYATGMDFLHVVDVRQPDKAFALCPSRFGISRKRLYSVDVDRDGMTIACSHHGGQIYIWDARKRKVLNTFVKDQGKWKESRENGNKTIRIRPPLAEKIFITPDGGRVFAFNSVLDARTGEKLVELQSKFPWIGAVSADSTVAVTTDKEVAKVFNIPIDPIKIEKEVDFGPPGSSVDLGSEVKRMFLQHMNEGQAALPTAKQVVDALAHEERAFAVESMFDVYAAHVLLRTLQDKGQDPLQATIPNNERPFLFLWRTVYMKMPVAATTDHSRQLARRICDDAFRHGLLQESEIPSLLMQLYTTKHFQDVLTDLSQEMRNCFRRWTNLVKRLEKDVWELKQAADFDKKAALVRFGLALVPVIGGACSAFIDAGGAVIMSWDPEHLISLLTGNFEALGNFALEMHDTGGGSPAEVRLANLVYSEAFLAILSGHSEGEIRTQLETVAVNQYGSLPSLRSELWEALQLDYARGVPAVDTLNSSAANNGPGTPEAPQTTWPWRVWNADW